MKNHKLWIIILIMIIEGSLSVVAQSTESPDICNDDCTETCDYATEQCVCDLLCGKIISPLNDTNSRNVVNLTYTFPEDKTTVLRLDDFSSLGSRCFIQFPDGTILDASLDDSAKMSFKVAADNSFSISKGRRCDWTISYFHCDFQTSVRNLTDLSGVVDNPFALNDCGPYSHRPNSHTHYIIKAPSEGYVLNLDVHHQNMGVPFKNIHDQQHEVTTGDMIMVGSGTGVLSGDDVVLYGSKSLETTRMRIFADVAHVSISYTSFQDVDASFNYSFIREEEITTVAPTTVPTTPTPPNENYFTFAAINGIQPKQSEAEKYEPAVKGKIAEIANRYAEEFLDQPLDYNITEHEVAIYNEKKCNSKHCDTTNCVAYNFSILYMDEDGNWFFNKERMDEMVWQYREEFANIPESVYDGEPVCNENVQLDVVPYIVFSVSVVVIGCIISLIVYRAGMGSAARESKSKYKKENEERMDDERRRSSGNISFMGIGNTRDSITSMASSRKFSMPFPSANKKPKKNVKYDMSGFKEFNPEDSFGGEPVNLGLEKEMLGNKSAMKTYYSNEGYIPDEEAGHSVPTQQQCENQDGSSSASSSDNEDDGPSSSFPPLGQSHDLARRQLQEKLATIQASDSEVGDDSDDDVVQFNRNPVGTELKASIVPVDVHFHPDHEGETIL